MHPEKTYNTYMENSTLILTALLQLNEELRTNDAFCGYNDDHNGTQKLLEELWDLYYAQYIRPETAQEMVDIWYENFFCLENFNGEVA